MLRPRYIHVFLQSQEENLMHFHLVGVVPNWVDVALGFGEEGAVAGACATTATASSDSGGGQQDRAWSAW